MLLPSGAFGGSYYPIFVMNRLRFAHVHADLIGFVNKNSFSRSLLFRTKANNRQFHFLFVFKPLTHHLCLHITYSKGNDLFTLLFHIFTPYRRLFAFKKLAIGNKGALCTIKRRFRFGSSVSLFPLKRNQFRDAFD